MAARIAAKVTIPLLAIALGIAPLVFASEEKPNVRLLIPWAKKDAGDFRITSTPPDPPPHSDRHQLVFDLRWSKGDVYLNAVNKLDLPAPRLTPRVMGRFALELFEGPTLIERVRFDFPMLGATTEGEKSGWDAPPSLTKNLSTRIGVMFPAIRRGTRLELYDRATETRWSLPWPVNAHENQTSTRPTDAGAR